MTPSTTEIILRPSAEDHRVARHAAAAIVLTVAEAAIPLPLPGVKPGLANIIVLVVLARWGWREAVWVALLRVLVSSLLLGQFLAPGFFLSLARQCGQPGGAGPRHASAGAGLRAGQPERDWPPSLISAGNWWWRGPGWFPMTACSTWSRCSRWRPRCSGW
jgi:hypothetical protein